MMYCNNYYYIFRIQCPSLALLNSVVDLLEKAMEMEYTYGSQNGLIPVVDYVLNSLNKVKCTTKFNPSRYNYIDY